jgi:peptide-methionine (R)-S-oxide reductase
MTKEEAKKKLTPAQYNVCFLKGTEPAGSGEYDKHYEKGIYKCVVCDKNLFSSDTKYNSGSGWPAFFQPIDEKDIKYVEDNTLGMSRTEVQCANCNSHLGHIFDDGPEPTGQRYCINSLSLQFEKAK